MINSNSDYFFIHHHLGLGDHIVCNGLVRFLYYRYINRYKSIKLAVKHHNSSSVAQLYRDIDLELDVVGADWDCEPMYKKNDWIKIGFKNCCLPFWEKSFYDQIGLDYSYRYSHFHISRNLDREKSLEDKLKLPKKFAFCNANCSRGSFDLPIQTNLPQVHMSPLSDSLFDWVGVLHKASEIHTIDTSIYQLIKQLNLNVKKYFYHIGRGRSPFFFDGQDWEVINI